MPASGVATGGPMELVVIVGLLALREYWVFLPGLAVVSWAFSERWAAALGVLFILWRAIYARGYVQDPAKRCPGFLLTMIANATLVLGGLVGTVLRLL